MVALQMPSQLALPLAQYLALFRVGGQAVPLERVHTVLSELLPMLQGGYVEVAGQRRPANLSVWQRAIEQFVVARAASPLAEPLVSNLVLLDSLASQVDEAVARANLSRDQAADRQQRIVTISQARGDLALGLITPDQAKQRLSKAGINPEVLDG